MPDQFGPAPDPGRRPQATHRVSRIASLRLNHARKDEAALCRDIAGETWPATFSKAGAAQCAMLIAP
jgi:hypothetical protein